jgi:rRNA maturation RNase YbeY
MSELAIRNRQRVRRVDLPGLRRIVRTLLEDLLLIHQYELGVHLVTADEIAELNETFLHHEGSTDVITLDYAEKLTPVSRRPAKTTALQPGCRQSDPAPSRCPAAESVPGPDPPVSLPLRGRSQGEQWSRSSGTMRNVWSGRFLPELHGEVFICLDDAVTQARRFRTTWQKETVRYLVHGILHLRGFDDLDTKVRRRMKRQEDRLLKALERRFPLSKLARELTVRS